MAKEKWKEFEEAAHNAVQNLNPSTQVLKNVHIVGKLSKVKRQIDVQLVKPDKYEFIAFECKDYKRHLDVSIIEAFNTKLQDIKAKKGAIVSNSSYTQAAKNMASKLGIDLLNLVNTKNKNIRAKLYASLLLSDTMIKTVKLRLKSLSPQVHLPLNLTEVMFMDEQGHKGTAYEIFASLWNETESSLSRIPGIYEYRPPNPQNKRIIGLDGEIIIPTEIAYIYEVIKKNFAGQIEIIETEGLYDVKKNSYQTKSLQTKPIIPYKIEKKWPEISEEQTSKEKQEGKFSLALECSSILPNKP